MKNKKGITLQFHWIFILIAGGIILAFFFSIASKQKVLSDEKLSLSLVQSVDMIFEMAESSEGTSQIIPLPRKGLSLTCSKDCDCYVQTGSARKSFGNNIIFSENRIEAPEVVVWSLPWKVPFRAANILYISNPETRKIFVFDNSAFAKDLKDKLNKVIPANILFEQRLVFEYQSVSYDGSDLTKVIFVGSTAPFVPPALQKKNVELISINPQTISFYDVEDSSLRPLGFVNYPADITWVLAAVVSADKNMFICGLKSALKRLNFVADIFSKRSEELADKTAGLDLICLYPADEIKRLIIEGVEDKTENELYSIIANINSVKDGLRVRNNQLIEQSCPELF